MYKFISPTNNDTFARKHTYINLFWIKIQIKGGIMKNLKISFFDSEHVEQAQTELDFSGNQGSSLAKFISQLKRELVPGQTAYFEIDGFQKDPLTFEITQCS